MHRVSLDAGFGCPHRAGGRGPGGCIFCGSLGAGRGAHDRGISLAEQMAAGTARLARSGCRRFIAYFQAFCGTYAPLETLARVYREAAAFPGVVGLSVGTRPDLVPDPVLGLLARFAAGEETGASLDVWLELGLQSAHDDTLRRIRRGHDRACFDDAVCRAHGFGLPVAAHVILGLPGEGSAEEEATAAHLARLRVEGVKLHHLYVEEGTELARRYAAGAISLLTAEAYVMRAAAFLRRLPPETVILRVAGRADPARRIAPAWDRSPGETAQAVRRFMAREGMRQGDLHGKD